MSRTLIGQQIAKAKKLLRILSVGPWRRALLLHRVAAATEHNTILKYLGNINTVVDVGANRGQFALMARARFPECRIVSFEPLPVAAKVCREAFRKDTRFSLIEAALGPEPGKASIHVSARDDSSSLLPIGESQVQLFAGTQEVGTQEVRVVRADDVIESEDLIAPALLKIDVQGFELQALEAMDKLLSRFEWVYVECSFVELYEGQALAGSVIDYLSRAGFMLDGVYNVTYAPDGRAMQSDFLFKKA